MQLTAEQVLFFHLNGYLSIPTPITDDSELSWMREVYDRIFQERAGRDVGDQFDLAGSDEEGKEASLPQILSPAKYAPELLEGKYLAEVDSIVKQLFGPEAGSGIAHAIFKPAGSGAATPWHQDEAYWDPRQQYYKSDRTLCWAKCFVHSEAGAHSWRRSTVLSISVRKTIPME